LRVSTAVSQDWENTRNQPIRSLPYFDRERSSLPPLNARMPPGGAACLSATDGALIEWRREEIEGSVPVLELSFDSRFSRSPPDLNPPPCAPGSNRNPYRDVKMKFIPRAQAKNDLLAKSSHETTIAG
jgi:hypothetical protein